MMFRAVMKTLLALLVLAMAAAAFAQPLTRGERDRAMSHMQATRKMFLDALSGLSDAQWKFKPDAQKWSIAECAEHVAISEDVLFDMAKKVIAGAATPEKKHLVRGKDETIPEIIPDRSSKRQAPEALLPKDPAARRTAVAAHFKESRDRNIAYIESTQEDLRTRMTQHRVMGDIDAYQMLLVMSAHTERHVRQIEEIKSNPLFPK